MRRTQIILVVAAVLAVVLYFMDWPTAARVRSHALQLSEAGQHEKAIKELRRLIEEYPRHRIAAKAKKDISEIEAEKLFQEALACVGSSPRYYSAKLCLLPLQQHYPGSAAATKADERLAELYSEEAKLHYDSATAAKQQGRHDDAWDAFKEACEEFPDAEYGPKACDALASFTLRARLSVVGGKVRQRKPDGLTWDPRIPKSQSPPDPFVCVYSDGELLLKTQWVANSWWPSWNESVVVELNPWANLRFELWDRDGTSHDRIGDKGTKVESLFNKHGELALSGGNMISFKLLEDRRSSGLER